MTTKALLLPLLRVLLAVAAGAFAPLSVHAQSAPSQWTSTTAGWATPDGTCSGCHGSSSGLSLATMPTINEVPSSSLAAFLTWFNSGASPFSGENGTMSSFYGSSNTASQTAIWHYLVNVRDGTLTGPSSSTTIDFGDVLAGATATPKSVTLTNYRLISASFGGKTYSNADFSGGTSLCTTISTQQTCSFNVSYTANGTGADASGNVTATLTIGKITGSGTSGDPAGVNPLVLTLKAHVVPLTRIATLSTGSLSFSSIVNTPSAAQTATLTNTGNSPLTLQAPAIVAPVSGTNAASDYAFGSGNTCAAMVLQPTQHCTIAVVFTPSLATARNARVSISSDGSNSPSTISLLGMGSPAPVGHLVVDKPSVTMPDTIQGQTSAVVPVTVTNTGTAAATLSALALSGADAADFHVAGTCAQLPTLAISQSCEIDLTFTPSAAVQRAASLAVQSNADNPSLPIPLGGQGLAVPAPIVTLSAAQLDFGPQTLGGLYPARPITLSNTGNALLQIASLQASGTGFAIVDASACPGSLAAGGSCTINVTFTPTTAGTSYTGAVTVASNASTSPDHVDLHGSGTTAAVPVLAWVPSVQTLAFGSVLAGSVSTPQSLTLTNQGPGGAVLQLVNTVGSDAAAFSITAVDCQIGQTVYQGQSCSFGVSFAPGVAGARNATVQIVSTGSLASSVALTGTGLGGADLVLSLSASTLDFGAVQAGTRSQSQVVRLTNSGPGTLQVSALDITGPFAVQSGSCPPLPFALTSGADCTVSVMFQPTTSAAASGTLSVKSDAQPQGSTVSLNGQGDAAPELSSGGCSISRGDSPTDPVLWTLAGLALAALGWRARQRRRDRQPGTESE
jgi:hypothetical protein